MVIYFIRHGHRADMEPGYTGGGRNPPLSQTGHEQAELMAEVMAGVKLSALYSSCQLRAMQTAKPLHERIGGDWHVWPCLCETNEASWDEVYEEDPEKAFRMVAWQTDVEEEILSPEDVAGTAAEPYLLSDIPGRFPGTSLTQPFPWPELWWRPFHPNCREKDYARLELALRAIIRRHEEGDEIAIIGHGNATDMCVTILMGLPRDNIRRRMGTANTCITRLQRVKNNRWLLNYANNLEHLPHELRTYGG